MQSTYLCSVLLATLHAQGPSAPADFSGLVGSAGWTGVGLLGLVLFWLLIIHLPSKDKQLREYVTDKDEQFREYVQGKDAHIEKLSTDFHADLKLTTEHCERELREIGDWFRKEMAETRTVFVSNLRDIVRDETRKRAEA